VSAGPGSCVIRRGGAPGDGDHKNASVYGALCGCAELAGEYVGHELEQEGLPELAGEAFANERRKTQ
jgi:hypothetical protein